METVSEMYRNRPSLAKMKANPSRDWREKKKEFLFMESIRFLKINTMFTLESKRM